MRSAWSHSRSSGAARRRALACAAAVVLAWPSLGRAAVSSPNPGDIGQAVAAMLVFALLLVVLGRYAWGPVIAVLRRREEHVAVTVEQAEKKQTQAERLLVQYKEQLDGAERQVAELVAEGRTEAEQQRERILQEARSEARELSRAQSEDLRRARREVQRELYAESAELATEIAERLVRRALTPEEHRRLVRESLDEIRREIKEPSA